MQAGPDHQGTGWIFPDSGKLPTLVRVLQEDRANKIHIQTHERRVVRELAHAVKVTEKSYDRSSADWGPWDVSMAQSKSEGLEMREVDVVTLSLRPKAQIPRERAQM